MDKQDDELREIPRENGRVVLAHGEQTGHSHSIAERGCRLFVDDSTKLDAEDILGAITRLGGGAAGLLEPSRIMEITEPVNLAHEEHDPIPLSPGELEDSHGQVEVVRQREYDPEALQRLVED